MNFHHFQNNLKVLLLNTTSIQNLQVSIAECAHRWEQIIRSKLEIVKTKSRDKPNFQKKQKSIKKLNKWAFFFFDNQNNSKRYNEC